MARGINRLKPWHHTHHILSVLVENKVGVLTRVASLFSRRGYNIVLPHRRAHGRGPLAASPS